jgi:hypothetical protein
MADSTPAPAHSNWRSVVVDYGSLVAILGAVLVAQATAYLTLYGQLTSQGGQLVGVGEHLKSIDRQLARVDKRLDGLEDADRASAERDRQLLAFITERDRELVAVLTERDRELTTALNDLKLSVARIEARLGKGKP